MKIKIIVGANFGDEGKGLMTDYFSYQAANPCLVIKSNGGSQAGHTVTTPDNRKHIFHHFGSGVFTGAETYLAEDFIVNPILFHKERETLLSLGEKPFCLVHKNCRITTPYDMLINQFAEESRREQRHGSCGMGIYETIIRNEKIPFTLDPFLFGRRKTAALLDDIRENYIPERIKELGIQTIPQEMMQWIQNENIKENFLDDCEYFQNNISLITKLNLNSYETILFECGQGLLLDQNNTEYMPYLTPSNTGIQNPIKIIKSIENNCKEIEICYVTRTYMTRHGAGRFDSECKKEEIGNKILDETNISNQFQGNLRYGYFDKDLIINMIKDDLDQNLIKDQNFTISIAFTHMNETKNLLKCKEEEIRPREFLSNLQKKIESNTIKLKKYYLSYSRTRENIKQHFFD